MRRRATEKAKVGVTETTPLKVGVDVPEAF